MHKNLLSIIVTIPILQRALYKEKNTNQRKVKSISDLLVMARPARLAFGTLLQSNGLGLKQDEEFVHSFNVKQIKCIEASYEKLLAKADIPLLVSRRLQDIIINQ